MDIYAPKQLTEDQPIGGKAEGLLQLHRLGAPVPQWRVIPANRVDNILNDSASAQRLIDTYQALDAGSGVAVRSSSVLEDGRQFSNAGAFETRFCENPHALRDAIAGVIASAEPRDSQASAPMAVVLQTCVTPTVSGVLFSAHPSAARPNEIYVEYVAGKPTGLVDGTRSPHALWLDPATGKVLRETQSNDAAVALPDALREELCMWLCQIETVLNGAVDMEWAVVDEKLWLLQARPVTRLFLDPGLRPPEAATSWFFDQRFAEPIRPLTQSTLLPLIMQAGFEEPLKMRGAMMPDGMAYEYGGQRYMALTAYHRLLSGIPYRWLTADLKQLFPDGPRKPMSIPGFTLIEKTISLLWRERRDSLCNLRTWQRFYDSLEAALDAIPDADGHDALAWSAAWKTLDEHTMAFLRIHRWSIALADGYYGLFRGLSNLLPASWRAARQERLQKRVRLITIDANQIRERKNVGDDSLWPFGHRSASLDYACPTWDETLGNHPMPRLPSFAALRNRPRARGTLPRLLELREEQRFVWEIILARQRRLLLHAADRLIERGLLPDRDALWWMTADELHSALHDGTAPEQNILRQRARVHLIYTAAVRPLYLIPDGHKAPSETLGTLQGLGASAGRVQGVARVIHRPDERPDTVPPGTIVVLPCLDPGSTALMASAAGLVIERGGLLSHAAIVAREYSIPLVIGVPGVVETIENGDYLELDGETGSILRV